MYQTPLVVQNEMPKCRHFVTIKGCLNLGRYYVIDSYLPDTGAYEQPKAASAAHALLQTHANRTLFI